LPLRVFYQLTYEFRHTYEEERSEKKPFTLSFQRETSAKRILGHGTRSREKGEKETERRKKEEK
jgi:hypothetical protein